MTLFGVGGNDDRTIQGTTPLEWIGMVAGGDSFPAQADNIGKLIECRGFDVVGAYDRIERTAVAMMLKRDALDIVRSGALSLTSSGGQWEADSTIRPLSGSGASRRTSTPIRSQAARKDRAEKLKKCHRPCAIPRQAECCTALGRYSV